MPFNLKIETYTKNIIELTNNESDYQVIKITGLNPPQALINVSNIVGMDGALFNSSRLETRNVVITVRINGDVERNRLNLYKYFRNKENCKIYFKNESRNVFIEGYVETLEVDLFENGQTAQISIICPNPYFKDLETIIDDISKVVQRFKFPFSININEPIPFSTLEKNKVTNIINDSDSETGLIVNTVFYGEVNKFEIRNVINGDSIILNYNFKDNDILIINCNKGSKSILLTRNAQEINLIPYLQKGSKFFQLKTGENQFSYLADDGDTDDLVHIKFEHYNVYRGV